MPVSLIQMMLTAAVLLILSWIFKRYRKLQLLKRYNIPGPKPDFFSGHLYQLKKEPTPHNVITSWLEQYGDIFGYYMGGEPYVVVKDMELLKRVIIKDSNLFINRPDTFLDIDILPKMLLGLKDKRWKEVRTIITPMFSSGKMKVISVLFSRKVDVTIDIITKKAENNEIIDIYSLAQGLTLDVIGSSALAMNTKCQEDSNDSLRIAVRNLLAFQYNKATEIGILLPALGRALFNLDFISPFGKALRFLENHIMQVIKLRRMDSEFKSIDILQALLDKSNSKKCENNTNLTEVEVIANALLVLMAGYETTATSLAFTCYLLVKHPEVQQRLYEEIQTAEDESYSTIQGLQYMDQVYNESLRLYPPVTGLCSRTCSQDYQYGTWTIPKGAHVLAPVWDIHHDPKLWTNPWKFDPERFSPANKSSIKSIAFMPFGDGPRNCIGARFAQLEAKLMLFKLLKKFKLQACEETEEDLSLVTHFVITLPKNGVWIKASLR